MPHLCPAVSAKVKCHIAESIKFLNSRRLSLKKETLDKPQVIKVASTFSRRNDVITGGNVLMMYLLKYYILIKMLLFIILIMIFF